MQAFDPTRHSTLEPIRTALQNWWANKPSDVSGIALYGSRAKNYASQDSDWDVAILTRSEKPNEQEICRDLPRYCEDAPIHALCESIETVRSGAGFGGNILSAVVEHGVSLFGESILMTEGVRMKPSYIAAATSIIATVEALTAFLHGANVRYLKQKTYNNHATAYSANAAEHLVKGFLSLRGINYRYIHDIAGLCDQLEQARPNDPIVEKLRRLDGFTTRAHKGPYQSIDHPLEALTRSTERVNRVLPLLPNLVAERFSESELEVDILAEITDVLDILQECTHELQDASLKQEYQSTLDKICASIK